MVTTDYQRQRPSTAMDKSAVTAVPTVAPYAVRLAENVFEIHAVDDQAKTLIDLVKQMNTQLDLARAVRRQKSGLLTRFERRYMDNIFSSTEVAIRHVTTLLEPSDAATNISTDNIQVALGTRLLFYLRDSPKIQITLASLVIASRTLNQVVGILFAKEGHNTPLVCSNSDQSSPLPTYAESISLMHSKLPDVPSLTTLREEERRQEPAFTDFARVKGKDELFFSDTMSSSLPETYGVSTASSSSAYIPYRPGVQAHVAAPPSGRGRPSSMSSVGKGVEEPRRRPSEMPSITITTPSTSSRISTGVLQTVDGIPALYENGFGLSPTRSASFPMGEGDDLKSRLHERTDSASTVPVISNAQPRETPMLPAPSNSPSPTSDSPRRILRKHQLARQSTNETPDVGGVIVPAVTAPIATTPKAGLEIEPETTSRSPLQHVVSPEKPIKRSQLTSEVVWRQSSLAPKPLFQTALQNQPSANVQSSTHDKKETWSRQDSTTASVGYTSDSKLPEPEVTVPQLGAPTSPRNFLEYQPNSPPRAILSSSPAFAPEKMIHVPLDSAPEVLFRDSLAFAPEVVDAKAVDDTLEKDKYDQIENPPKTTLPEKWSSKPKRTGTNIWLRFHSQNDLRRPHTISSMSDLTADRLTTSPEPSRSQAVSPTPLSVSHRPAPMPHVEGRPPSSQTGLQPDVSKGLTSKPDVPSSVADSASLSLHSQTLSDTDSFRSLNLTPVPTSSVPTGRARSQRWREAQYEKFEKLQTRNVP